MRIMVFDVPAEHGGALSILKEYYVKAEKETANEWIFVISKPELEERENIKVVRLPWVKKSWFHRLYFDKIYSARLIKKYMPDKVISLQNTVVNAKGVYQELYVHQPLPFCEKRFTFKENKIFWIYQNIISRMIIRSIRKADKIIVQTKWMRDAVCKKSKISVDKAEIIQPDVVIPDGLSYKKDEQNLFFYPASGAVYKNHDIIYKAASLLVEEGYEDFKIILTKKKPTDFSTKFKDIENKIEFCGRIDREKVYDYYSKSVLLFPSYIETFGLPLLEARKINSPVIASNCAFCREILTGYDKATFFDPFDYIEMAGFMKKYINK